MSSFNAEAFTLLGVGLSIVALRLYARISLQVAGLNRFRADDYVMLIASVVYTLETIAGYFVGARFRGLANSGMTDEYRQNLDPHGEEWRLRVGGSKLQVIGWPLCRTLLWLLKVPLVIYYSRLTENVNYMEIRIKAGLGILVLTYVAVILTILLGCGLPMSKMWQINPDPGNHCQPAISKPAVLTTVILNIATDIYLVSIPLPMLWKAKIPRGSKYLLLLVFSGAAFVMSAGLLRAVFLLNDPVHGAQYSGSWAIGESFVAVLTSNVPMIYPLVHRWTHTFFDISMVSTTSEQIRSNISNANTSGGQNNNFHLMPNQHRESKRRGQSQKIGLQTFASEEDILSAPSVGGESAGKSESTPTIGIKIVTESKVEVTRSLPLESQ